MNIALFSDSYTPTKSGIVTVVTQLEKVLRQLGHHVVVVTVAQTMETEIVEEGSVLRIKSIISPAGEGQYIAIPHKRRVLDFLLAHNIQLIHAHTEFSIGHIGIVCGAELNIPVVATTHTMWEDYYKYYLAGGKMIPRRVIRKVVQQAYKKFYAFINVSQKAHDYFNRSYMLPNIPSAVIPNAIDVNRFAENSLDKNKALELRESLGISSSDRVLLYVGRVVEEKRVLELCDLVSHVVQKNPSIKVVFVGSGGAIEDMSKKVNALGLEKNILFTGFVEWENLPVYYSIGDVFITASLSEMHSMTILEALAVGLPIICRNDTSFSDTVYPGKNGYTAETDEEMEELLLNFAPDAEKCHAFGNESRKIAEKFSFGTYGKKHVQFYEEVLKHFPNPVTSEELFNAVNN